MTQIVVTLENNADETFVRRMIENMKGVVKASLIHSEPSDISKESPFLESLHAIKSQIDPSAIDYTDPRTQYLMAK